MKKRLIQFLVLTLILALCAVVPLSANNRLPMPNTSLMEGNFRTVQTETGWRAYNLDGVTAPCGTVISAEEFVAAQIAFDASNGQYMPEVFRVIFPQDIICMSDIPDHVICTAPYENSHTIKTVWELGDTEPTITIYAPNGDALCINNDYIPYNVVAMYIDVVSNIDATYAEIAAKVADSTENMVRSLGTIAPLCSHNSTRMVEVGRFYTTTSSSCWIRTVFVTIVCNTCGVTVSSTSFDVNGPSHSFVRNPQGRYVCSSCFWVR